MESPNSEPSSGDSPAVPPATPPSSSPPARPPSRRRLWLGSLIALVLLLVLGGGAWYFINRKGSSAGGPGFGGATVTVGHTQAALVRQLEGTVTTDLAAEAAAKLNLDYTRITAPVAGRIGLRAVDAGNTVTANATTGIAVITQMNPIDVQFSVPQDRVPDIQAQLAKGEPLPVTAFDRTRAATLDTGTFSTLDNVVDTTTGTVKAKARFGNAQTTLFPSQFVNVQMLLRKVRAVVVPVTAVRTGPNGDYVYVINEDRTVSMRAVKRGEANVEVVAITSGLKAGENVVTEGGDRIKDGAVVQLQGDRPAAGPRGGASGPRGAASGPRGQRGEGGGERRRQRPPQ
ncbi:MAG: efflux RND transporter periplasmic adaptor subunit [Variovorax paradoxus]|nr:efflux RND transporter periplasmic adaptor subunit [Variovorax paradoxus]MBW8718082.1 efflux RND transporter periplasmic adaptor subunit [Variovorax paradoxus]